MAAKTQAKTTAARKAAPKKTAPRSVPRVILRVTYLLVAVAGVGSLVLSYAALMRLGAACGLNDVSAAIFPLILDAPLVGASVAYAALAAHPTRARAFPLALLCGYALVSVLGNACEAAYAGDAIPTALRVAWLSVPPVTLVLIVELGLVVGRRAAEPVKTKPTPAASVAEPVVEAPAPAPAVVVPEPVVEPEPLHVVAEPVDAPAPAPRAARVAMTPELEARIRELRAGGLSLAAIASETGASKTAVGTALKRAQVGEAA